MHEHRGERHRELGAARLFERDHTREAERLVASVRLATPGAVGVERDQVDRIE